ncbi:MAG: 50S ribosomal protein L13 [Acidilobus sp.]|nr:50S ribosomal protein L13 [Acidilobus sp.]MCG2889197.1 50S ribosomal protein L13 [Acidilobus sp.]MCG2890821.1 50S ribosomal protein L13 [Acidilobus sp.]
MAQLKGVEAKEVVIDGEGAILGRMASLIAKLLLEGHRVVVVNAEKVAVSGDPSRLIKFYRDTVLGVRSHYSHKWRPKRPRSPQRLVIKAVHGMLPKNKKGEDALSRLRVFVGMPKEYAEKASKLPEEFTVAKLTKAKYATLGEIARQLGWKVGASAA